MRNRRLPYSAYHDSLGAILARLGHVEDLEHRKLRVAARLLRTVATRAAVAPDLLHLDVYGREFITRERPVPLDFEFSNVAA